MSKIDELQHEWLERHKDADQLVCGTNSKQCLAAVYFSPKEKHEEKPIRDFFKPIVDAMTEECES